METPTSKFQHSSPTSTITPQTFKPIHDDFETPWTDEDLLAIDAAFEAASTVTTTTSTPSSSSSSVNATLTTDDARPRTPFSYPEPISFLLTPSRTTVWCLQASATLTPVSSSYRINTTSVSNSVENAADHARSRTRRWLPKAVSNSNGGACSAQNSGSFAFTHCRTSSSFWEASVNSTYPAMKFGGRIVYCRTIREVEEATLQILKLLEAKKRELGRAILGLDIEWRPTFKRGIPQRKASVMQICGDMTHCFVLHIIRSGIPRNLQSLLEDSSYIKVGVGINNDVVKVFRDHNICIKSVQDLAALANQKLGGVPKKWSLSSLVETVTCKQLLKPKKIRLGNWESNVLSKAQLQYAATDAFASWYLYEVLQSFPDPSESQALLRA